MFYQFEPIELVTMLCPYSAAKFRKKVSGQCEDHPEKAFSVMSIASHKVSAAYVKST